MSERQLPRQRPTFLIFVAFIAAGGLWPIKYIASPHWTCSVIGDDGKPLAGISVSLVYENYSVEDKSHEVTLTSDADGRVVFPMTYGRASALQWIYYTVLSSLAGVHASFGRHAYVFAFGNGLEGSAATGAYVTDWSGESDSLDSTIAVAKPGPQ